MRELTDEEKELWLKIANSTHGMAVMPHQQPSDFSSVIDLHHLTLQQAYFFVLKHIEDAVNNNYTELVHITGRSGEMKREYPHWIENHPNIRSVKLNSNGGSWTVWLKK